MSRKPPPVPAHRTDSLMEHAVDLHRAGRLAEAIEVYEDIIRQVPEHFDATHLLGVIALQEGRLERAKALISAALQFDGKHAAALNNLGTALLRSGEPGPALELFERALKLQPNFFDALANLGTALRQMGRPREALPPLRRAHSANPRSALVCNLIGACLMDIGESNAAIEFFEASTLSEPDDADGWGNLAIALNNAGDHVRAQVCADKAVSLRPGSSAALAARAAVEFEEGRIETAIDTYREAVALPDPSVQTYCAYANALWTGGRCEEALDHLRHSVAMNADNVMARWKLALSECRPYYGSTADVDKSRKAFAESIDGLRAWFQAAHRPEAHSAVGTTQPFFIAYQPFNNRELLGQYGRVCVDWMASMPNLPSVPLRTQNPVPSAAVLRDKMRIGIASAHIRDHSVWNAITKGWIEHLDKSRFEIWLFQLGRTSDGETSRAKSQVDHFETGPKTLQEWVRVIDGARLDALIYPEIGMDTLTTQLACVRLAPVQAASWGHPETTGLPTIDLYLSADALEPPDADGNYTERLVRLPGLGVCVEPLAPPAAPTDIRSLGLPDDEPLLLCPGTPFKYSPFTDHIWARIAKGLQGGGKRRWGRVLRRLGGTGNGRLVFFRSGNVGMDELLMCRLRSAFDAENVDFNDRVRVINYLARPQFFSLMQQSALLLDTVGFSGFNNALQAVEAGLPVLAREATFLRGRLASGVMRRMGLDDLVARDDESFIQMAVELAGSAEKLGVFRAELARRRGVLFNDVEPVRALEQCLTLAINAASGAAAGIG